MEQKEHRYIGNVTLLALGCAAGAALVYGFLVLLHPGGLSWLWKDSGAAAYAGLAGLVGYFVVYFFSRRFEKAIWGTVCRMKEKLPFPLSLLRNLAIVLAFYLFNVWLESRIVYWIIAQRYTGDFYQSPNFSVEYGAIRRTAQSYMMLAYGVLLFAFGTAGDVRRTCRLHREQEQAATAADAPDEPAGAGHEGERS